MTDTGPGAVQTGGGNGTCTIGGTQYQICTADRQRDIKNP
jgi:hypothetical protein